MKKAKSKCPGTELAVVRLLQELPSHSLYFLPQETHPEPSTHYPAAPVEGQP